MNLESKGIIQFEAQREKLVGAKSHDDLWVKHCGAEISHTYCALTEFLTLKIHEIGRAHV